DHTLYLLRVNSWYAVLQVLENLPDTIREADVHIARHLAEFHSHSFELAKPTEKPARNRFVIALRQLFPPVRSGQKSVQPTCSETRGDFCCQRSGKHATSKPRRYEA